MRGISYAWTTPALLVGASPDPAERAMAKTCTRREWDPSYAASFKAGEVCAGYERSSRVGGKKVAEVKILRQPYLESTADMPDSDWIAEGFKFLWLHPKYLPAKIFKRPCTRDDFSPAGFDRWRKHSEMLYVVRFELVRVMPGTRVSYD